MIHERETITHTTKRNIIRILGQFQGLSGTCPDTLVFTALTIDQHLQKKKNISTEL